MRKRLEEIYSKKHGRGGCGPDARGNDADAVPKRSAHKASRTQGQETRRIWRQIGGQDESA
jgi:hypothetical protein